MANTTAARLIVLRVVLVGALMSLVQSVSVVEVDSFTDTTDGHCKVTNMDADAYSYLVSSYKYNSFDILDETENTTSCNLRAAVAALEDDGGIVLMTPYNPHLITRGPIEISSAAGVSIRSISPWMNVEVVAHGSTGSCFTTTNAQVDVRNLDIIGFSAANGGAMNTNGGRVAAYACNFKGNSATRNGGAVFISGGVFEGFHNTYQANFAEFNGGAVYVNDGQLSSNEEVFIRNSVQGNSGAAIFIANGNALTTSGTFTDNKRIGSGAGLGGTVHTSSEGAFQLLCSDPMILYLDDGAEAEIAGHGVTGDLTPADYCNIRVTSYVDSVNGDCSNPALYQCNLRAALETATQKGGGIITLPTDNKHMITNGEIVVDQPVSLKIRSFTGDMVTISGAWQSANTASRFLSVMNEFSVVEFDNVAMTNFADRNYGGALYLRNGAVTLYNCLVDSNKGNRGGALYIYGGSLMAYDTAFTNNKAAYGGAVYIRDGTFLPTMCSFTENAATGSGSSVFVSGVYDPLVKFGCRDGYNLSFDHVAFSEYDQHLNGNLNSTADCMVVTLQPTPAPTNPPTTLAPTATAPTPAPGEWIVYTDSYSDSALGLDDGCTPWHASPPATNAGGGTCNLRSAVDYISNRGGGTIVLGLRDVHVVTEGHIEISAGVSIAIVSARKSSNDAGSLMGAFSIRYGYEWSPVQWRKKGFYLEGNENIAQIDGSQSAGKRLFYINNDQAQVQLVKIRITDFTVDGSGTVYLRKGLVSAEECQFAGNSATGNGGVFMVYQGVLYTEKCSFEENTAAKSGGAVYVYRGGYDSALTRFERNHATTYGGGVYIRDGNFQSHANAFFDNGADGGYGRSVFNQGTTTFTCPDGLERYRFNENYEEYEGDIDGDLSPPDYCAVRVNFNQDSLYGDCDDIDDSAVQVCNIRAALGKAERLGGAAVLLEPGSMHYLNSRVLIDKAVPIHIKPDKYSTDETNGNTPRAIVAGTSDVDGGFLQLRNLYARTVLRDIILQEFHSDTMNGGAVNVVAGHFEAINCIFQYNSAPLGGAVFIGGTEDSSSLTSNLATSSWTKAAFMTTNTLFRSNHAKATSWSKYMGGGGALYIGNWGYAFVESSDFMYNGMSRSANPDSGPAISVSHSSADNFGEAEDIFTGVLRWGCEVGDMLIVNEPAVVRLPNPEYSMYCGPWVFQNVTEDDNDFNDDESSPDENDENSDSEPLVRIVVDCYEDSVMGDCSSPNSGSCNLRVAIEMAANVAEEATQQGFPGGVGIIYVPVEQAHQITEGHIILDRAAHIRLQAVQSNAAAKSLIPITISGQNNQHRFLFLNHKNGVLEFENTIFENFKKSDSNGGVFFVYDGNIKVSNCDFLGNSAFARGGAIYVHLGHVSTSNSRYLNNNVLTSKTGYGGGAVYVGYGTFTSDSDVFQHNEAISSNGGGVFTLAGTVAITAGLFRENIANSGGAIYSHKGELILAGTSFVQNRATLSHGGAIYAKNGNLGLKASEFSGNFAQDRIGMSIYSDQVTVGWACNDGNEIIVAPSANNLEDDLVTADYCQKYGMTTDTGDTPTNPAYRRAKVVYVNMFVDSHDGSCADSSPSCNLRAAIKEIVEENGGKGQIILPSTHVHALSEGQITLDGEGVDLTIKSSSSYGETESKAIISGVMQDGRFIYLAHKNAFLRLENLVLSEFQSLWGGALYVRDGTLVVTRCTFDGSTSYYYGAALVLHGGYSVIKDSRFLSNFAGRGGAVYQNGGYLNIEESEFLGNVARFYGGGIYSKAGVLRMESNRFEQNRAMDDGKGNSIYNTDAMLDWVCPENQYLFDHPGSSVVNKDLNVADYCTLAIIRVDSYEDSVGGICRTIDVAADGSSEEGSDDVGSCNLRAAVMLAMEVGGGEILVPTAQDHFMTEGMMQLDGSADVTITPDYSGDDAYPNARQTLPSSYAQDFSLLYDNGGRYLKSPHDYVRVHGTNNTEKLFYVSGSEMHLHMERVVFDGFSSTRHGGVVYARRGTVSAYDCLFINNHASRGGAIYLYEGIAKISHSIFMSNSAQYGGAIYLRNGAFQIILSSLLNNLADNGEGNSVYLNSGQLLWDCGDNFEMYALPEDSEDLNGDIYAEDYCVDLYEVADISSSTHHGEMFVVVYVSSQTPDSFDGTCTTDDVEYRMNVPNPSTTEHKDFFTSSVKVVDTFDITGSGQSTCNLRAAVELVELFGSGTVVLVSDDTYWITEGEIEVDTAVHLAITSRSSTQLATVDGTHNKGERLLYVSHEDAEVLLDDLVIEKFRSDAGSVVYLYNGKITISDSVLSENQATSNGGVAYMRSGTFVADDTLFQNNFATFNGGSVYVEGGHFTADTCWFDSNSADAYGGAVYVRDGNFETLGSGFLTNLARVEGTAVYNHAGSVDWQCSPDNDEKQQVLWSPNDNDYHKLDGDLSATEYCAGESGESVWKVNQEVVSLSRWDSNIEKQLKMIASQQQEEQQAQLEDRGKQYGYKYNKPSNDNEVDDRVASEAMVIVEVSEYSDSLTGSCTIMAKCQDQRCAESLRALALEERAFVQDDSKQFQAFHSIEGITFNDFHAMRFVEDSACNLRAAMHLVQAVGQGIILLPTKHAHHMVEGQILVNSAAEIYILPTFEGNSGSQAFMAEIDGTGNNGRFLQLNHENAFVNMESLIVKNFQSDFSGAGVYIRHGNLFMRDSVLADNRAAYSGGSVYIWEGSMTASTCVFSSNSAAYGGALYVRDGTFNAHKECSFYGNSASSGNGHSIFTKQKTRVEVTCHDGRSVLDSGLYNKFLDLVAEERQHVDVVEIVIEGAMNEDLSPEEYCAGQYDSDSGTDESVDKGDKVKDKEKDKLPGPEHSSNSLVKESNETLFAFVALATIFSLVCTVIGLFVMLQKRRERQAIEEYQQKVAAGVTSTDNRQPAIFSDVKEYEKQEQKRQNGESKGLLSI